MQTDEKLTMSATEVIAAVVELQTKREGQAHSFRTSLYEMLGAAYPLALELGSRPEVQTAFKKLPGKGKSKFEKKADAFRHVVRLVFGKTDRRRVSDYANVLVEASEQYQVRPDALRKWIDTQGTENILRERRIRLKARAAGQTLDQPAMAGRKCPRPPGLELEHGTYVAVIRVDSNSLEVLRQSSNLNVLRTAMRAINEATERAAA